MFPRPQPRSEPEDDFFSGESLDDDAVRALRQALEGLAASRIAVGVLSRRIDDALESARRSTPPLGLQAVQDTLHDH
jgi:hypothetical protein